MNTHEFVGMRNLTSGELDLVGGGTGDIIVTARLVRLDGGGTFGGFYNEGGRGFNFGGGGESGGGGSGGADSDGDGTLDANDEAPYDASNNTIVVTATAEQYRLAISALVDATVEADLGFFISFTAGAGAFLAAGAVGGGAVGTATNAIDISQLLPRILAAHQEFINSRADSLYYDRLAGRHAQEQ
jgi:hypothetical protein